MLSQPIWKVGVPATVNSSSFFFFLFLFKVSPCAVMSNIVSRSPSALLVVLPHAETSSCSADSEKSTRLFCEPLSARLNPFKLFISAESLLVFSSNSSSISISSCIGSSIKLFCWLTLPDEPAGSSLGIGAHLDNGFAGDMSVTWMVIFFVSGKFSDVC
uniref:Inositol polyphosphate 5-phosphatase OCRL-1 n=1 Tax=Phallusia mammillata TaxID=59560 RepID=A0A6F9DND7_9ASCI|nr:inositol polyphosphate 5-phosphatase OCRL-1 [Phallusia mammillata]